MNLNRITALSIVQAGAVFAAFWFSPSVCPHHRTSTQTPFPLGGGPAGSRRSGGYITLVTQTMGSRTALRPGHYRNVVEKHFIFFLVFHWFASLKGIIDTHKRTCYTGCDEPLWVHQTSSSGRHRCLLYPQQSSLACLLGHE